MLLSEKVKIFLFIVPPDDQQDVGRPYRSPQSFRISAEGNDAK
jgi:hypothetical protein